MDATIVFQQNWNAIHALNEDGTRKYRYIINRGSSRSSKTISLIQCYDLYARKNDNKRLTVWRDTKTDCKKTVLNDMLKQLKRQAMYKVSQDFNKTESIFTYTTDSTIEIHGTDDEETVHGLTQDGAWFNEPYKISKDTFDQIDQRTSDFIFIDYNPKKGHWVDDLIRDPRAIVIHSTFKDNPFCPVEQKIKILSYQPCEMASVVLDGILNKDIAITYDCDKNELQINTKQLNELLRCIENEQKKSANKFKWQVYGLGEKAERPNRIFSWTEISDVDYLKIDVPIYYGVDWGKVDPWGVVEAKYLDGCLYLHEKNYASENEWRDRMTNNDRSIITSHGTDEDSISSGIVTWLFNKLQIDKTRPIICDNNRPTKIASLRRSGYDNAEPARKGSGSIIDGIEILSNLQVFYTSSSENIAFEQENYSYKIDRYGVVLDEAEDTNNHTIDPTRYIVTYLQSLGIIRVL